jgi:hypothetical protein
MPELLLSEQRVTKRSGSAASAKLGPVKAHYVKFASKQYQLVS